MGQSRHAKLGILMLDTRFPRIPGDIGNPATWPFEVDYAVVRGATPKAVVCEETAAFLEGFLAEGRRLVAGGCSGIATSCGFLSVVRDRLAAELGVPVAASALEQAPQIRAMLAPDRTLGILTISEASLTAEHLTAAGVAGDTAIVGVEHTGFGRCILEDAADLDVEEARQALVDAARELCRKSPHLGAILLECTNMPPHAPDIAAATGLPVFSIVTYLSWFHAGLRPAAFSRV